MNKILARATSIISAIIISLASFNAVAQDGVSLTLSGGLIGSTRLGAYPSPDEEFPLFCPSVSADFSYMISRHEDWSFHAGVGYRLGVMTMRNNYAYLDVQDGKPQILHTTDAALITSREDSSDRDFSPDYRDWTTRIYSHYVTMPLRLSFDQPKMQYNLTFTPMYRIGKAKMAHQIDVDGYEGGTLRLYSSKDKSISEYMNPFNMTLCLDIMYRKWIGGFIEGSLLPVTKEFDHNPHFISVGVRLRSW